MLFPSVLDKTVIARRYSEMKQNSASATYNTVTDGAGYGLVNLTSLISQGVADNQRVGDHLYIESLRMQWPLQNGYGATANPATYWRIIVFQFLGDNSAAAPTIAGLFLSSNANAGNTQGTFSSFDIDHTDQYIVLHDSGPLLTVGTSGLAATGQPGNPLNFRVHVANISLKRCDRNIRYYAGGTTGPNHIYFLITTDQASIATNPAFAYLQTLQYSDQ
jgi:hypothetical protein